MSDQPGSVHVGEIHSEVVEVDAGRRQVLDSASDSGVTAPGVAGLEWREARDLAEQVAARVRAEGFDD